MTDVVVLGGGISGCACAHRLSQSGYAVSVLEKGRGVGGRMATRRMEEAESITVPSSSPPVITDSSKYSGIGERTRS